MATIFDLPDFVKIRSGSWRQTGGVIYNRSTFTGATRTLRLGPAARWSCELEFAPTGDEADLRLMRQFMANLSRPDFAFRLPAVEVAQAASPVPATCLVMGANQLGQSLICDGLPNSTAILSSGHLISVALGADDEQLLVLNNDFTSNGSGEATFTFTTPLRKAPANNAVVKLHTPTALMRLRDPVGWNVAPATIYDFPALTAEEYF